MNAVLAFTSFAGVDGPGTSGAAITNGHSLSQLTVDGNGVANFSVQAAAMTRSKFHTVTANNAKLAGIYVGFGWINNFVECSFHSNGLVALYIDVAVNAVNVLDCTFETNRGIGILVNYGAAVRIEGNCLESQGGPAIVANAVQALTIKGNYYEANLMGGHLPPTAGTGLISFVDSSGKPVHVCADQVLNGEPWHGFHTGAPLVLSGAEPCQAVVIEGNYHNPGASLCGHRTQVAASGELFAGTLSVGAQDVAVRANRCGSCLPPNCKNCKRCVTVTGVNASSLKSDVNSGWAAEAGTSWNLTALEADRPTSRAALSIAGPPTGSMMKSDDAINISSSRFSIVISPSCTAVTTVGNQTSSGVPFVSLYNAPADSNAHNFDPCVSAALLPDGRSIRIGAANGYGTVDFATGVSSAGHLYFRVQNMSSWNADPAERHIQFGEFWTGILNNVTAPVMMGKVQGPRGIPGSGTLSAGFVTVTENAYYRWVFDATEGDELAFSFAGPSSADVAAFWQQVGRERDLLSNNGNRFLSWFWTDMTEETADVVAARAAALGVQTIVLLSTWASPGEELVISNKSFPHGIRQTVDHVMERHGIKVGIHMHPDIVWPCRGSTGLECLSTGIGIAPMVHQHLDGLVPEGLAPTFRSGSPPGSGGSLPTEDLGFWHGHDPLFYSADCTLQRARNGNPKPCGQGTCMTIDWKTNDWGPDILLHNTSWSDAGVYRGGLAIGFDGDSSYGSIVSAPSFHSIQNEITLGLVLHPAGSVKDVQVLFARDGVFMLSLCAGRLLWQVNTTDGHTVIARGKTVLSTAALSTHVVKCTYNSTSALAKIFLSSVLDGVSDGAVRPPQIIAAAIAGAPALWVGAAGAGQLPFKGAMEEIYLKNVSAENRAAYLFADDNRMGGSFLIDLTRPAGQKLFAAAVCSVINSANISAVEYDGMEKLELMSYIDFAHSLRTVSSGVFRGPPAPDFFAYQGFPLRVGIGMIRALELAHSGMNPSTAVETTGIAPGLGKWRPDMSAYVDERVGNGSLANGTQVPNGFIAIGLQWHGKMLQRVELTGTAINPYNTGIDSTEAECRAQDKAISNSHQICSSDEVDYWFGGLVATGVAPQPMGAASTGRFDTAIGKWLRLYSHFGHFLEETVQTLHWDYECCHAQGVCEWKVCQDIVATALGGGMIGTPALGVYAGANVPARIPSDLLPDNATVVVFQAFGVESVRLDLGTPQFTSLRLAVMGAASNITLSGGFFLLNQQNVRVTVVSARTGTVKQRAVLLWPEPQTGQREWHGSIVLEAGAERPTYVFEKV